MTLEIDMPARTKGEKELRVVEPRLSVSWLRSLTGELESLMVGDSNFLIFFICSRK
jgi:hypothetical protein